MPKTRTAETVTLRGYAISKNGAPLPGGLAASPFAVDQRLARAPSTASSGAQQSGPPAPPPRLLTRRTRPSGFVRSSVPVSGNAPAAEAVRLPPIEAVWP